MITKVKAPITPPAMAASGDFEEEDFVIEEEDLVIVGVANSKEVADGVFDAECVGDCDENPLGGEKRGMTSVVTNSNLSNSNWVLPFAVDPRFVITTVWKVSGRRGVSKYTTSKIADPFDDWEVMLGGPPSTVNCTKLFPTPPATVPQTRNR
jgi:hypothetical protein